MRANASSLHDGFQIIQPEDHKPMAQVMKRMVDIYKENEWTRFQIQATSFKNNTDVRTASESLRYPCSTGPVVNTKDHLNTFSTSSLDDKDEQNMELNSSYQTLKGAGLVSDWS